MQPLASSSTRLTPKRDKFYAAVSESLNKIGIDPMQLR